MGIVFAWGFRSHGGTPRSRFLFGDFPVQTIDKSSSELGVSPFVEIPSNLASESVNSMVIVLQSSRKVCWMGVLTLQLWELVMRFPVLNPREVQEPAVGGDPEV